MRAKDLISICEWDNPIKTNQARDNPIQKKQKVTQPDKGPLTIKWNGLSNKMHGELRVGVFATDHWFVGEISIYDSADGEDIEVMWMPETEDGVEYDQIFNAKVVKVFHHRAKDMRVHIDDIERYIRGTSSDSLASDIRDLTNREVRHQDLTRAAIQIIKNNVKVDS